MPKQKLTIVSNRLPIQLKQNEEEYTAIPSSGGLVSVLSALKKTIEFDWIGWPGLEIPKDKEKEVDQLLSEEYGYHPIFLTKSQIDRYYYGFSNSVLWPLFHYSPDRVDFSLRHWEHYKEVNQKFADKILEQSDPDSLIWIHDYHLFLVPEMIRKEWPNAKIGFFLHIPFPSSEIFRLLPAREEILKGLLGADLIGFHCFEYVRHFSSSCKRILHIKATDKHICYQQRHVKIGTFPIGIDFDAFFAKSQSEENNATYEELRKTYEGKNIILGVDRLDYIKGIPQKLHAFEKFLEKYPEYRSNTILIQVGLPSRIKVTEYKNLKDEIDTMVGRINGQYGKPGHTPIQYIAHPVNFTELCALYRLADALLVTSLRDGMNLVCLEYIASQYKKNGVLILSEYAGAAHSLNHALTVNPWDILDIVEAIHTALNMDEKEKLLRQSMNFQCVKKQTSLKWGEKFIKELAS